MKRINFLPRRTIGNVPSFFNIDISERTRRAFVACAATIALVSFVSFIEERRVDEASQQARDAARQAAAVEARLTDLTTVTTLLTHLSATARDVAQVRREAKARLSNVVALGDLLPSSVWLTGITEDDASMDVHARAKSTQDVGYTMMSLDRMRSFGEPRLVDAHLVSDRGTAYVEFEITLAPRSHA